MFISARSIVPSLIFENKARNPPQREVQERCFTWIGLSLKRNHYTRFGRPAKDKHSSLSGSLIIHNHKKLFMNLALFLSVILRVIFVQTLTIANGRRLS
jgi:hypothetical protein